MPERTAVNDRDSTADDAGVGMIDLERLMRLRLVVARVGEMDLARWWDTRGQLGSLGSSVLKRGFPRTHHFAQARSVFAVAAARCREVYDAPGSVTLWNLPPAIEDEFAQRWETWLEDAPGWQSTFAAVEKCGTDLQAGLTEMGLIDPSHLDRLAQLRRTAQQRAVQLPGSFEPADDHVAMLALGFARSEVGSLAVPHQSWDGEA